MCKGQTKTAAPARSAPRMLLTSVESFSADSKSGPPLPIEIFATGLFVIALLVTIEYNLKQFMNKFQHLHPLLEDPTNCAILARHIGVDAFSCFVVAYLGWRARHINRDLSDTVLRGKKDMLVENYSKRIFEYHPEAMRITVFFFAYQIKNFYDTIVWNDGPEFIAHHALTLATAWGGMFPPTCHYYVMFYFGMSEVSTGVLCLLANFDDVHGVKGLADAWPLGKVVLGGLFAVLFLICRVLMWSTYSYHYCRDVWQVLKSEDKRLDGRRAWLRYTFVSLALLSLLQIIWLGEIVRLGYAELKAMGFIADGTDSEL